MTSPVSNSTTLPPAFLQVVEDIVNDAARNTVLSKQEGENVNEAIRTVADKIRQKKGKYCRATVSEVVKQVFKGGLKAAREFYNDKGELLTDDIYNLCYDYMNYGPMLQLADQIVRGRDSWISANPEELELQASMVDNIFGDENIMSGVAHVQTGQIDRTTALQQGAKQILKQEFTDEPYEVFVGDIGVEPEVSANKDAVRKAAIAVNTHGMQYGNLGEVPRIALQLQAVVNALGPEDQIDMVRASGMIRDTLNDDQEFAANAFVFFNRESGHYAAVLTKNGDMVSNTLPE